MCARPVPASCSTSPSSPRSEVAIWQTSWRHPGGGLKRWLATTAASARRGQPAADSGTTPGEFIDLLVLWCRWQFPAIGRLRPGLMVPPWRICKRFKVRHRRATTALLCFCHEWIAPYSDCRRRPAPARVAAAILTEQGFRVTSLPTRANWRAGSSDPPHLVVLDWMMPHEDGVAVCKRLRGGGDRTPIIMLTAKGRTSASTALTPAPTTICRNHSARANWWASHATVLRRVAEAAPVRRCRPIKPVSFGDCEVNFATRTLTRAGEVQEADHQRIRDAQGVCHPSP